MQTDVLCTCYECADELMCGTFPLKFTISCIMLCGQCTHPVYFLPPRHCNIFLVNVRKCSLIDKSKNKEKIVQSAGWYGGGDREPAKKKGATKGAGGPKYTLANKAMERVDVSLVETTSKVLSKAGINVLTYGKGVKSKESIARLVKQHGGEVHPVPSCTTCHCKITCTPPPPSLVLLPLP